MKLVLEIHRYAPEMNKARVIHRGKVSDTALPIQGITEIWHARKKLFPQPKPGIWADVCKIYPAEWAHLNRRIVGRVEARTDAIQFAKNWREKEKGGPLLDGSVLPAPRITIKTRLVA